jgi:hypothetical protein
MSCCSPRRRGCCRPSTARCSRRARGGGGTAAALLQRLTRASRACVRPSPVPQVQRGAAADAAPRLPGAHSGGAADALAALQQLRAAVAQRL